MKRYLIGQAKKLRSRFARNAAGNADELLSTGGSDLAPRYYTTEIALRRYCPELFKEKRNALSEPALQLIVERVSMLFAREIKEIAANIEKLEDRVSDLEHARKYPKSRG